MTVTRDDVLFGALSLRQPEKGPRVNVDTILLAAYVRDTFPAEGARAAELGCASGAVSLILARRFPRLSVAGLEIQEDLAALARENALLNGLDERVRFFAGDLREENPLLPVPVLSLRGGEPSLRGAWKGEAQRFLRGADRPVRRLLLPVRRSFGGKAAAETQGQDVRGL